MLKKSLLTALALFGLAFAADAQNLSSPANPDTMFCNTRGSIATRLANRWQCLTPGTSGQVLKTNGPGADAGWLTVTGTGTVTSVDMTVPGSLLAVTGNPISTSGTFAITTPNQLTNLVFASPNGSTGAPTFRALAGADIPAIALSAGGNGGTSGVLTVAKGGTNASSASGTAVDNISGFSGTGIMRRTGAGTYTFGTGVTVAEGGTGGTSASGTLLDNITGFSSTGVIQRTGAGTYTFNTIPAILGSQTANTFFAAPNGSAGNPSFRTIASADIPSSLALAGVPTAPTAVGGTNTTQLATTAFVQAAVSTLPGGPTYVYATADETSTTTSYTNSTQVTFPLAASTRYNIECRIYSTSSTTNNSGSKIAVTNSAAVNAGWLGLLAGTTGGGTSLNTFTTASTRQIDTVTASTSVFVTDAFSMFVDNAASANTISISFALATSGGTMTLRKGSYCTYMAF